MESSSLEEEKIIKDVRKRFRLNKLEKETYGDEIKGIRNLFRLKMKINGIIRNIRNLFRLKKENKTINDRIIRDTWNLFENEGEDYYKPVRVGNFWSNSYIEYKSKGNRKTLSVEEYLNKIKPYLKIIMNNLKKSVMLKIQLTIAISFTSSKDNDEYCVMHSKSDNIEIIINVKEIFDLLIKKYQIGLEKTMGGSDFILDCVHLLYYKCHKINSNRGGSYIDSPDWIKTKKQQ